jgi:pyruvate,water dikinase
VAEGTVRVLDSTTFADVRPGDVLVCETTDPSWASVLFLSGALVVDVGGLLSHAAVVARELGVPCVVGTGDGTTALRTGDRVRVDGTTGSVEILSRAEPVPAGERKGRGE